MLAVYRDKERRKKRPGPAKKTLNIKKTVYTVNLDQTLRKRFRGVFLEFKRDARFVFCGCDFEKDALLLLSQCLRDAKICVRQTTLDMRLVGDITFRSGFLEGMAEIHKLEDRDKLTRSARQFRQIFKETVCG